MTIPAGAAERREKLEHVQDKLERAQEAVDRAGNIWDHHRAQEQQAAALRCAAALYRGG